MQRKDEEVDPLHEKYTAEYIQREAFLLMRYLGNSNNRRKADPFLIKLSPLDNRILDRHGIR